MVNGIIKSESDYEAALAEIEKLIDQDPDVGTPEGNRLELLALLIQDYESRLVQIEPPSPIEAIKFRMEQQDLSPRDLIPHIGSRSKVSEVLSGKRPLTLSMIQALNSHLGIPAKVLIQGRDLSEFGEDDIEWDRFPLREMITRGWIDKSAAASRDEAQKILHPFLASLNTATVASVLYLRTSHVRSARSMDEYALTAWAVRVMNRALEDPLPVIYRPGTVNLSFMQEVARLSPSENGPLLARRFLMEHGISLIVEPHLPRTYLDGAAILMELDRPVIGLTLRYDRTDNFWFCLMHELAHIALHQEKEAIQYFDDLDVEDPSDPREREADELAGEALIPQDVWIRSAASRLRSSTAAESLAKKLQIHPAIVAGRMRYEFKAYRLLNRLVGHHQVRKHFPEIDWS